jgi:hypothetical protein
MFRSAPLVLCLTALDAGTGAADDAGPRPVAIVATLGDRHVALGDGALGLHYFPDLPIRLAHSHFDAQLTAHVASILARQDAYELGSVLAPDRAVERTQNRPVVARPGGAARRTSWAGPGVAEAVTGFLSRTPGPWP